MQLFSVLTIRLKWFSVVNIVSVVEVFCRSVATRHAFKKLYLFIQF